jgi:hypothetical protein
MLIAQVFSTKVERERPDIEPRSNFKACLTDQLMSLPSTAKFLEATFWSLYAIKPFQLVNYTPFTYIRIAISLGNKVNYKPNLWHWPKTGSLIFYFIFLILFALLRAYSIKRERL